MLIGSSSLMISPGEVIIFVPISNGGSINSAGWPSPVVCCSVVGKSTPPPVFPWLPGDVELSLLPLVLGCESTVGRIVPGCPGAP